MEAAVDFMVLTWEREAVAAAEVKRLRGLLGRLIQGGMGAILAAAQPKLA